MAAAYHLLVAQLDQYFAQAEIKALDKAVAEVRFFFPSGLAQIGELLAATTTF